MLEIFSTLRHFPPLSTDFNSVLPPPRLVPQVFLSVACDLADSEINIPILPKHEARSIIDIVIRRGGREIVF